MKYHLMITLSDSTLKSSFAIDQFVIYKVRNRVSIMPLLEIGAIVEESKRVIKQY
jgi:hypothetical protein